MNFVPSIPDWFDTRKAAQVTAWFAMRAGGRINILRATKLVYLADRLGMEWYERPLTGDDFVSMPFGPVNTYTYSYMKGKAPVRQDEWGDFVGVEIDHDLPLANPELDDKDLDELSRADLKVLNATWDRFKDIVDQFDLAEWTHEYCPEWRNPHGSSIPIDFATVFDKLEKDRPVELAENIQAERELRSLLAG